MLRIGLFGIGLDTYWPQFEGLYERLSSYHQTVFSRLSSPDFNVIDAGMVDSPAKAKDATVLFQKESVDVVVLFITTYALSQTVLPLAQSMRKPLLVLNLQPEKSIDYSSFNAMGDRGKMTGEWLAYCQSCVAPEIASVMNRSGISFQLISGYLQEDYVWNEVSNWLAAAHVSTHLMHSRIGLLGHYYNGMLDVYSDLTQLSASFGSHFEIIEMGTLKHLREHVVAQEIEHKLDEFGRVFEVAEDCTSSELDRAALTSVALDKLVAEFDLNALAYYYEGTGDASYLDIVTSLIPGLTLLTGKHVPVAGEYEVKNVIAMKILDLLGCGGSFSEFYALDFEDDVILLGHDGPAHFAIAEGRTGLIPLPVYHGKPGKGLSIQMKVMTGAVTLLSVCQDRQGKVFFLVAEGDSVEGPTLQIANTNSRYRFGIPVRTFIDQWSLAGPSHHCAIGVGHKAAVLQRLALMLDIECKQIC
jgi:L-arabinose isomerase